MKESARVGKEIRGENFREGKIRVQVRGIWREVGSGSGTRGWMLHLSNIGRNEYYKRRNSQTQTDR